MFFFIFYLCILSVCFTALVRTAATFACLLACRLPPPVDSEACGGWDHVCGGCWELSASRMARCSGTCLRRRAPEEIPYTWSQPNLSAAHIPHNVKHPAWHFSSLKDPQVHVERRHIWVQIPAQPPNNCETLGHFLYFLSFSFLICKMDIQRDGLPTRA